MAVKTHHAAYGNRAACRGYVEVRYDYMRSVLVLATMLPVTTQMHGQTSSGQTIDEWPVAGQTVGHHINSSIAAAADIFSSAVTSTCRYSQSTSTIHSTAAPQHHSCFDRATSITSSDEHG
ncbi:hypothetical protein GMORB2_0312 [Geosmithia morbida]|uniref:Uncharacterized protein n=1 Tax=Geosmithia morbida TaxID=1094350 RepID=A0A9P4Z0R4_9HYPO|nr:uncharacterized protein GMORB2_0312 [Geosmithia morbida]KAF4126576.1 hypothetical protein GMORB2_0312 [Geosmithia morbida]